MCIEFIWSLSVAKMGICKFQSEPFAFIGEIPCGRCLHPTVPARVCCDAHQPLHATVRVCSPGCEGFVASEPGSIPPSATAPDVKRFDRGSDCTHRQKFLRYDENNLCGTKGQQTQIFGCTRHGTCSPYKYCQSQKPHVCLTCSEHVPSVSSVPSVAQPLP